METYAAFKLYNHLKYQRVLTWINPHLDLKYKNYVNTQNLNVNLVHSTPISFEAPSLFSSTSNITITKSYQYLLPNWVNIDLYATNPYCNDILNIRYYSMDLVLSNNNSFNDVESSYTYGSGKLIKEEQLFNRFDIELEQDFYRRNAHLYKLINEYYYSNLPLSNPSQAVNPTLLTYSINKRLTNGPSYKYIINNLPAGKTQVNINDFSFYIPERGSGYMCSNNLSSSMDLTDLESVAFGILNAINNNNDTLVQSLLQGIIDFYITAVKDNFIGFPKMFNKYNYSVINNELYLYENAILGYAICKALNYLQDRLISQIVKFSDTFSAQIVGCLNYIANFVLLTKNEYTGLLSNGLTVNNSNTDRYSLQGMVTGYFYLQEYLKINYNVTVHLFAADLELTLTELNQDITNPYYSIFINNEDLLTTACFLAWFYKVQNNQDGLDYLYETYFEDIVAFILVNTTDQRFIKKYLLLGLICYSDTKEDYIYYSNYLNVNTEFDPIIQVTPLITLQQRTIIEHTFITYVNNEKEYLLVKPFNLKGLELELYKSYLVDSQAIMSPKGLKWPTLDTLEDPSTVIGSLISANAEIANKNYLDYSLILEGLDIREAQGFVLNYYSDIYFPKPGLVSDTFWQDWLAKYVERIRETKEAIYYLCDLFGEEYPDDYSDSVVNFDVFHDNEKNLATPTTVNLTDVGADIHTYIKQIDTPYVSTDQIIPSFVDSTKPYINKTYGFTHYFDGSYDEIIHDWLIVTGDSNYGIEPLGNYLGIIVFCQEISPLFYKSLKETLPLGIKIVDCKGIVETIDITVNLDIEFSEVQADLIPPTVIITLSDYSIIIDDTYLVTFTFSEPILNFSILDITAPNGTLSQFTRVSSSNFTAVFTPTLGVENNTNTVSIGTGYTDLAGNIGVAANSSNYVVDTIRPSVAITMSDYTLISGNTPTVTFTFSEPVASFISSDITAPNGTISSFTVTGNPLVYTATFTPTASIVDNTNTIVVEANTYTDILGNLGLRGESLNYTIDTTAPTVSITMSDYNLKIGDTSIITFTFSETPIGFTVADVTAPNGTLSGFAVTGNPLIYTALFTPDNSITDSTNVIAVGTGYTDAAGNTGVASNSPNYTIDTVAPSVSITMSDYTLTVGETATVTFTFSEAITGFVIGDITAPNGTLSSFTVTGNPLVYTATFTPTPDVFDETNIISVAADSYLDIAGNLGLLGESLNYTIDTLVVVNLFMNLDAGDDTASLNRCAVIPIVADEFTQLTDLQFTVVYDPVDWLYNPSCGLPTPTLLPLIIDLDSLSHGLNYKDTVLNPLPAPVLDINNIGNPVATTINKPIPVETTSPIFYIRETIMDSADNLGYIYIEPRLVRNMTSFSFTLKFNPSVIMPTQVIGFQNNQHAYLTNFTAANFNFSRVSIGEIGVSWSSEANVGFSSLDIDNYWFIELEFDIIQANDCGLRHLIEFTGGFRPIACTVDSIAATLTTIPGIYRICDNYSSANPTGIVTITTSDAKAASEAYTEVILSVTSDEVLTTLQYTLEFDSTKWEFDSMSYVDRYVNQIFRTGFDLSQVLTGKIGIIATGIDQYFGIDKTLYKIRLKAIGSNDCGVTTNLTMTSSLVNQSAINNALVPLTLSHTTSTLEICNT